MQPDDETHGEISDPGGREAAPLVDEGGASGQGATANSTRWLDFWLDFCR